MTPVTITSSGYLPAPVVTRPEPHGKDRVNG